VWLHDIQDTERITIEQFCQGQKNKIAYNLFFSKFVPAIVGPELFRHQINKTPSEGDLCTASDEAFTLLLLENSFARWVDIYDKTGGFPTQRRGDTKRTFSSDIEAKYTRGGIKLSSDKAPQKTKGWTKEGIERFNILFTRVKKDRTKQYKFDERFIKQKKLEPPVESKKRKSETIQAAHSLWDDDDCRIGDAEKR
jgi:hypothetical protein